MLQVDRIDGRPQWSLPVKDGGVGQLEILSKQSAAYQARQARYRQWEAQQAYLRYRQGEWADPKPATQSTSLWQRAEESVANRLVSLGEKSPIAKRLLLATAEGWFRYGQPLVNATADFISGFAAQTLQNNLDALAMLAPMPPSAWQNYHNSWESIHSGRSVWYQAGRFTASLLGIVQGVWEMGSGIATASGGTVVSCGTGVLCFAGGGAAVVAGSAVAVHGALVTSTSIINTIRSGQALFASTQSGSGLRVGDTLPDHPDAQLVKSKTPRGTPREYEARVLNKPDPDLEIRVNGVNFDWYEGDTLLDAKNAAEIRSWYDVSQADGFTQRVKVPDIIEQAQRQVEALQGSSFNRIEWRVADPNVAEGLKQLFANPKVGLEQITVIYAP